MPKDEKTDLLNFLSVYPQDIQERALWLRDFVWELYPQCNELIYDNYNALAFGWSVTEKVGHTFCNLALGRTSHNLHFGFYWGVELADPEQRLLGNGNQYRYLLVNKLSDFPQDYVVEMLKKAYQNSLQKVKDPKQIVHGKTITKSVSEAKRTKGSKKGGSGK